MLGNYIWVKDRENKKTRYAIVEWRLISFFDEPSVTWKVTENKKTGEIKATPIKILPEIPDESISYFRILCEAAREVVTVFGPFYLTTKSLSVKIVDLDSETPVFNELKKIGLI